MRRIGVGVHEEDRDRLDAKLFQLLGQRGQRRDIKRRDDLAIAADPLRHLETQHARNERLVASIVQIERIGPVAARDLEHVAEALGGEERGLGALALDQRVDHQRGAVVDEACGMGVELRLGEAVEHAVNQVAVGSRALGVGDPMGIGVVGHKIGEGAANVDGNGIGHFLDVP